MATKKTAEPKPKKATSRKAPKAETAPVAVAAKATPLAGQSGARGNRSTKVGVVVSNKMVKTVVVAVENVVVHGMYQKYIRRTSKFMAHCDASDCNVGDRVLIEETRPLSKRKRWNVREILSRVS